MEQWEKNFYISSIAGATNGASLVVMSKGKLSVYSLLLDFQIKWKKWKEKLFSPLVMIQIEVYSFSEIQGLLTLSSHIKSATHFHSSGSIKSGKRAFM